MLVAALAVSACGRSGDRAEVQSAARAFLAAQAAGDGEAACARLSRDTVEALERQEGTPCPDAVDELPLDGGAVTRVQLAVTNAKVDLRSGESVFLSREPDGWRLSAVGCRPEGGKPADRPFTCEVEA
jgi:hypothetical protein